MHLGARGRAGGGAGAARRGAWSLSLLPPRCRGGRRCEGGGAAVATCPLTARLVWGGAPLGMAQSTPMLPTCPAIDPPSQPSPAVFPSFPCLLQEHIERFERFNQPPEEPEEEEQRVLDAAAGELPHAAGAAAGSAASSRKGEGWVEPHTVSICQAWLAHGPKVAPHPCPTLQCPLSTTAASCATTS